MDSVNLFKLHFIELFLEHLLHVIAEATFLLKPPPELMGSVCS